MLLQHMQTIQEIVKFYNNGKPAKVKNTLNLDIVCRINNTNKQSMQYILCELSEKLPNNILFSHQKDGDDYEITFRTTETNNIIKEILRR